MLHPPGFYYVKKTREVGFWTFIRRWNHKPLSFYDIIKPSRIEHLQKEEPFSSDPYFNSPLTESNTLYLFIAHRECNRLIHRYLFSVKKLWGQYGHVYAFSIFLYSSVITSKLVTLYSAHFLFKRYWDNTSNRLGIKEAIFSISLAGTVMGL